MDDRELAQRLDQIQETLNMLVEVLTEEDETEEQPEKENEENEDDSSHGTRPIN